MAKKKKAAKKAAYAKKPKRKPAAPKKARRARQRKARRISPPFARQKAETFELPPTKPIQPRLFSQQRIAPEEEIMELPRPEALRTIEHKKRIPHAVTAIIAGALLAMFAAFAFFVVLNAGEFLSFSLSFAIFVGFSIFLYSRLEKGWGSLS